MRTAGAVLRSGHHIGLENVEQYIYHSKEENVFTLFDRICERELTEAEEVLDKILLSREADATQLAGGLLLQFRRLAGFKRMLADNYEAAEAFPKLRIFSKKNQKTYIEGQQEVHRRGPRGDRRSSWPSSTSASAPSGPTCTRFFCTCWSTISFREPGKEHGG